MSLTTGRTKRIRVTALPAKVGTGVATVRRRIALLVSAVAMLLLGAPLARGAEAVRKRYDLPADAAERSLRRFSVQSGLPVVFPTEVVEGIRTTTVRGEYSAHEALDRMIEGTALTAVKDSETGALTVTRVPPTPARPASVVAASSLSTPPAPAAPAAPTTPSPMNPPARSSLGAGLVALLASTSLAAQTAPTPSRAATNDAAIELSPFVVQEDQDSGYYASQTLAGGRLKQDLKNTGSAIQVITKDFMSDIAATGIEELFQYTTGTEVGGILGNFTGATGEGTPETFTDAARRDPDGTSRLRGLGSPDRTRNFFKTSIPFDAYNTGRVEINRGTNSFLFGLGSPAGLVNSEVARASFTDSNEVSTRLGSGGKTPSYRGSFNLNRVLVKDVAAIYVAALTDRTKYRQEPTYKNDDRQYGAITLRPFRNKNTVLSAHVENGRIRGNAPDVLLPWHTLDTFLDHPAVGRYSINVHDNLLRWNNPEGPSQAQFNALSAAEKLRYRVRDLPTGNTLRASTFGPAYGLVYDGRNGANPTFAYTSSLRGTDYLTGDPFWDPVRGGTGNPQDIFHGDKFEANGTGWLRQGFTDLKTFDFSRANLGWDNDNYGRDFVNYNLALQQLLWNGRAGFELAYDYQDLTRESNTQFTTINSKILFDINETLLLPADPNYLTSGNAAPLRNPNYGRPFIVSGRTGREVTDTQQSAARFTGFIKLDLAEKAKSRWLGRFLGRHTFAGLFDQSVYDEKFVQYADNSFGDPDPALHLGPATARRTGTTERSVPKMVYIGPPQLNAFTDPNFTIRDFILYPAKYNMDIPDDYSISKLSWNLGPDANNDNIGNNSRINGNERWVEGRFTPREVPGNNHRILQTKVTSIAVNAQSQFFDDLLVVNTGYRQDLVKNWVNTEAKRIGLDEIPDVSSAGLRLEDGVFTKVNSDIFAYGGVLHWPRKLIKLPRWINDVTLHYNSSDNFVPEAERVDAYNRPLSSPKGFSKDYGVSISFLNNKVVARLNWYESHLLNATSSANPNRIYSNIFTQYGRHNREFSQIDTNRDGVIDPEAIARLNPGETVESFYPNFGQSKAAWAALDAFLTPELRAAYNYRTDADGFSIIQSGGNVRDTQDIEGRGFEAEITLNPTPSWRIAFNAAKQETILTNIAPRFDALLEEFWLPHNVRFGHLNTNTPSQVRAGTSLLTETNGQLVEYYTAKGQTGRPQAEQRKWRVNVVNRYEFREGRLRGFSVGGAVRWQDRYAYGYPIYTNEVGVILPVINQPYFAPSELNLDLTFGYRRKIFRTINWSAQVNIRNVNNWSSDGVSIIRAQPDGTPGRARFDPPREILLTNTFRF